MRETEHLKKLSEYAKKNMRKGYDGDSLKWALINQGNSRNAVEKAMEIARQELAREKASAEKPVIKTEIIMDEPVAENKSWFKRFFGL